MRVGGCYEFGFKRNHVRHAGPVPLSNARTRSISPENYTGADRRRRTCELSYGFAAMGRPATGKEAWKVNPYIDNPACQTWEIASIDGPGVIQHIWLTPTGSWRSTILRNYWDGQTQPSVSSSRIGDFFCSGWGTYAQLVLIGGLRQSRSAFNCYWSMPFARHCRMNAGKPGGQGRQHVLQNTYALNRSRA
jgi:hypothetical protein